jgi:hypothetical protein
MELIDRSGIVVEDGWDVFICQGRVNKKRFVPGCRVLLRGFLDLRWLLADAASLMYCRD